MDTASSGSIDHLLAQVAELFADGQLDSIEILLATIIANGDELQREMGKVYQEQLVLLRAEESSSVDNYNFSINEGQIEEHVIEVNSDEARFSTVPQQLVDEFSAAEMNWHQGSEVTLSENTDEVSLSAQSDVESVPLQQFADKLSAAEQSLHQDSEITLSENIGEVSRQAQPDVASVPPTGQLERPKMHILAEKVLQRAIVLIGVHDDKAIKLLNRIVEAGNAQQQRQALSYLAEIAERRVATEAVTAQQETEEGGGGQEVNVLVDKDNSQIYSDGFVTPPPSAEQRILAEYHTVLHDPAKAESASTELGACCSSASQDDVEAKSTGGSPVSDGLHFLSDDEQTTEWIPVFSNEDAQHNVMMEAKQFNDLRHPSEVLQADDSFHALPVQVEDVHGISAHHRQGFYIGNIALMIDFADGSELMDMPQTYRVPNAPEWLLGLTNIHSVIIPVFDLVRFFGLSAAGQGKKMLLILGHGDTAIGIAISGLPQRLQWQENQVVDGNTAPVRLRHCIRMACSIDGQLWFELDCAALSADLKAAIRVQ